jgi:NDP-sugar pyrophosphorylase family protein
MSVVGVILAGGYGTRSPINPKCMIQVDGKPILEHLIEDMLPFVKSISVLTNMKDVNQINAFLLGKSYGKPVNVIVEPHAKDEEKIGAYYGLVTHLRFLLEFERPAPSGFLVTVSDSYYSAPLFGALIKASGLRKKQEFPSSDPVISIAKVMPDEVKDYGNVGVSLLMKKVTHFVEKPLLPISKYVWTGSIYLPNVSMNILPPLKQDSFGYIMTFLMNAEAPIKTVKTKGWIDYGRPQDGTNAV